MHPGMCLPTQIDLWQVERMFLMTPNDPPVTAKPSFSKPVFGTQWCQFTLVALYNLQQSNCLLVVEKNTRSQIDLTWFDNCFSASKSKKHWMFECSESSHQLKSKAATPSVTEPWGTEALMWRSAENANIAVRKITNTSPHNLIEIRLKLGNPFGCKFRINHNWTMYHLQATTIYNLQTRTIARASVSSWTVWKIWEETRHVRNWHHVTMCWFCFACRNVVSVLLCRKESANSCRNVNSNAKVYCLRKRNSTTVP